MLGMVQPEPGQLYQNIENALRAPTWDAAREILQAVVDSPLEVHVCELYDLARLHDRLGPRVAYSTRFRC